MYKAKGLVYARGGLGVNANGTHIAGLDLFALLVKHCFTQLTRDRSRRSHGNIPYSIAQGIRVVGADHQVPADRTDACSCRCI